MSPAQKFFPTYFRPRNQYEIASGLCSVLVVLCPLIGHMAFQLFPQGIFSALAYTIPLGIIPGILAILSRSVRCVVLALCAAIFPITFFFVHSFIVTILYFISFGKIVLA